MNIITDPVKFEQELFDKVRTALPRMSIQGHVEVVHTGKWWVCYVFMSGAEKLERFKVVVRQVERELSTMCAQPICYPEDHATGVTMLGQRFYNSWLYVGEGSSVSEFKKFNPAGEASG